jgi:hypothetical protein
MMATTQIISLDLPGIPKRVGRPRTNPHSRIVQTRLNQRAYRQRQKQKSKSNSDNALSK